MSTVSADVLKDLAPTGTLRASINLGNIVLAQGTPDNPSGVTPELARELAKRLGVPVPLTCFDAAGKAFEAMKAGKVDIVFLAIEPVRAAEIEFTAPYVIIEGIYMVPKDSALKTPADVDRPGIRVGVNSRLGLRPVPHAIAQARHAGAQRRRRAAVPREEARCGRRREAGAAGIRARALGCAADGRALHGDPAGNGLRQGQTRGRRLPAQLHRGDEGQRLRRRCAQALRPARRRGRAGGDIVSSASRASPRAWARRVQPKPAAAR